MLLELDEGTSLVIEAEDGMCLVGSAVTFVVEGMPPATSNGSGHRYASTQCSGSLNTSSNHLTWLSTRSKRHN